MNDAAREADAKDRGNDKARNRFDNSHSGVISKTIRPSEPGADIGRRRQQPRREIEDAHRSLPDDQ